MMFRAGSSWLSDAYSSTRDLPSSFGLRIGKEVSLFDEILRTCSLDIQVRQRRRGQTMRGQYIRIDKMAMVGAPTGWL